MIPGTWLTADIQQVKFEYFYAGRLFYLNFKITNDTPIKQKNNEFLNSLWKCNFFSKMLMVYNTQTLEET